ncbi:SERF2 isoform 10 [Pongo abelii]|uniref:Small EDRK-rich factor 2 n=1 Tax=Pongo abelii TaxID=9601 RepID=A0A2J8S4G4_PONAB|nr:SERF2 isoform 10 [Pongo abelii]
MTRGNQRELARQKNMKKQSDSVKGKRRDDGLSAAARKQRVGVQQPNAELSPIHFHLILCALHPPASCPFCPLVPPSAPSSLPLGTRRSCSRSRKRQTRRRRNPSSFVASCPTLLPFACVPGASPTTLAFPPVVLTGPSTDGNPFALSLQRVPFVLPSPQVASLPLGHSRG